MDSGVSQKPYAKADHHTRAAKAQGYPARSVFKLEEIDRRLGLLRTGQHVVDLGAAPGSWSLYVAGRIGVAGQLLSVDIKAMEGGFPPNTTVVQGDALALDGTLHERFAPYDVVLSDMAPNTSGDKFQNAARSYDLFQAALAVAERYGAQGSHFVGKIFMGGDFEAARRAVGAIFARTLTIRPPATRKNSVEVFLVGVEKKAGVPVAYEL